MGAGVAVAVAAVMRTGGWQDFGELETQVCFFIYWRLGYVKN